VNATAFCEYNIFSFEKLQNCPLGQYPFSPGFGYTAYVYLYGCYHLSHRIDSRWSVSTFKDLSLVIELWNILHTAADDTPQNKQNTEQSWYKSVTHIYDRYLKIQKELWTLPLQNETSNNWTEQKGPVMNMALCQQQTLNSAIGEYWTCLRRSGKRLTAAKYYIKLQFACCSREAFFKRKRPSSFNSISIKCS